MTLENNTNSQSKNQKQKPAQASSKADFRSMFRPSYRFVPKVQMRTLLARMDGEDGAFFIERAKHLGESVRGNALHV